RRRLGVPDRLRHQPDDHDHGAGAPNRIRDRRCGRRERARETDHRSRLMTAPVATPHPTGVDPIVRDHFYIGGDWVSADGRETTDVIDATTEEVIGVVSLGEATDVDRAVGAARAGFEAWSQSSIEQRMEVLGAIAAGLTERADEI